MSEGGLTAGFLRYELEELKAAPRTVEAYGSRLKALERFFQKPWPEISSDDLRRLKRESTASSQTIAGQIVALRQAHRWGALEGHWQANGILEVRVPRVENEPHPPLSLEETRTLLEGCHKPIEYRLVWFGLYAGTRVSESARIGRDEWKDGVLRFKGAKTRRVREVPVHPELERARLAILCSPPTVEPNLHRCRREMSERLGIEWTPHSLRSTFATRMSECGAPWEIVMDVLGHSLGITGRYSFRSLERKREAVEALAY